MKTPAADALGCVIANIELTESTGATSSLALSALVPVSWSKRPLDLLRLE